MNLISNVEELLAHIRGKHTDLWRLPQGVKILKSFRPTLPGGPRVLWVERMQLVRFVLPFPLGPAGPRQPQLDALLHRINRALPLPCFSSGATGVGVTSYAMLDHQGAISSTTIDRHIALCYSVADAHYDGIAGLVEGN